MLIVETGKYHEFNRNIPYIVGKIVVVEGELKETVCHSPVVPFDHCLPPLPALIVNRCNCAIRVLLIVPLLIFRKTNS